jgi:hypothetical protein
MLVAFLLLVQHPIGLRLVSVFYQYAFTLLLIQPLNDGNGCYLKTFTTLKIVLSFASNFQFFLNRLSDKIKTFFFLLFCLVFSVTVTHDVPITQFLILFVCVTSGNNGKTKRQQCQYVIFQMCQNHHY